MCGSMTDIQSPTAEIRREKMIEEERNHRAKYNDPPITQGGHKYNVRVCYALRRATMKNYTVCHNYRNSYIIMV